ncbi:MAG: hypothetical protein ISQ51_06735, partial [Synechococcus sp. BS307-5m-G37]|nr:hypothetical protein [Synechococcus sp. BS307-5m-G37]
TAGLEAVQPSEELVAKHPFIYAGIHLDKIYELNLNSRTFTADGEIWLEWLPEVEELLQRYDTDPADLISLTNRIETWDSTFEPSAAGPRELSGGRRQLLFRFSSRFYDDAVDFRRDPFDVLKVPIIIELEPLWTSQKYADLRLLPAPSNDNLVGELGSLSGYQLQGASFKPFLRRSSNSLGSWYRPQLSQVRLEVTYQSNLWPGIVNWIIPLMIINSIVLMAPSVEGTLSDVRLAIPSTALLTLIFLQQSYHSSLPKLPYTTFLDDLFTTSYLIAMALFGLFTWGYNVYVAAPDEQKASTMRRINQADMRFQYLSLGLLVLTAVISWGRR